jgi:uncharacterized membrane protein YphA (DoxX/SURF4 family)
MALYALGAVLLGSVGFVVGDFALQWQPVPAGLPLHAPLAYLSAAFLAAGGVALLLPRSARIAALALGCFYALWAVLLHLPRVLAHVTDVSAWNGFAEITALAAGGFMGWTLCAVDSSNRSLVARIGRIGFGCCLLVFGVAHFVYADFTATMIPGWLPMPLFWAYFTGCGHLAAGISLVSGILARLGSTLLAAMFACFVVLLHLPRVFAAPTNRMEWTMLGIAMSLTGAAWIVRTVLDIGLQPTPPLPKGEGKG